MAIPAFRERSIAVKGYRDRSSTSGDKEKNADKVYLDFGNRSSDFDRTPGGVQQQIFDFQQWARGRLYSGGCGDADLQP